MTKKYISVPKARILQKGYLILLSATSICCSMLAQQSNSQPANPMLPPVGKLQDRSVQESKIQTKVVNSTNGSRWYNYGEACDAQITSGNAGAPVSILYSDYLFPDSTIYAPYGTAYDKPWIHFLGDVFDPKSAYFNSLLYTTDTSYYPQPGEAIAISHADAYTIDSVQVAIFYARKTAISIVDTLVIEIGQVPDSTGANYFLSPISTNLGTDTVFFIGLKWNYPTRTLTATGKQTYKVLLHAADVADTLPNGSHMVKIACTGLGVFPANSLAASAVSFRPGYTWVTDKDTITKTKNTVQFATYKENAGTSFPSEYQKRDWNCSYIIPDNVNHNLSTNGWNGSFVPSFAYLGGSSDTYGYEHHLIYYHVSCSTCSMASTNDIKQAGLSLGNLYPNPVLQGNDIYLPVNLFKKAAARIVVYDLLGKQVSSTEEDGLNIGQNELKLNTSNLQAGSYLVSVILGDESNTVRVVIMK